MQKGECLPACSIGIYKTSKATVGVYVGNRGTHAAAHLNVRDPSVVIVPLARPLVRHVWVPDVEHQHPLCHALSDDLDF